MSEQTNDTNKNKTKNIEKTQVADIDRSIYDIRNDGADDYRFDAGLSAEIVERLSREKNDPDWMREFRLRSLEIYNRLEVPDWGPDISGLDMDHIATYVRPKNNKMQNKWDLGLSDVMIVKSAILPDTSPISNLRSFDLFPPQPNRQTMRFG